MAVTRLILSVLLLALAATPAAARAGDETGPSIAVASSLRQAMPALVEAFTEAAGRSVRPAYGASGQLTRQVLRGAPFELFLAANTEYPARVVDGGRAAGEPVVYAWGRIGLFVPAGSALAADGRLEDLGARLEQGTVERFAIPNPAHAPYGVRARQALQRAGLWDAVQPVLVLGENAAQTAQFAASGSVDGALLPASLATTTRLRDAGRFAAVPPTWYEPLAQSMVLIDGAGETARRFRAFMQGERAAAILRDHGFAVLDAGG